MTATQDQNPATHESRTRTDAPAWSRMEMLIGTSGWARAWARKARENGRLPT